MKIGILLILPLLLLALGARPVKEAQGPNPAKVTIKDGKYEPSSLTIKKGTTVTWTNMDDMDHTVDADDGAFSSGTLKFKQTFEHTFSKPGKFAYGCKFRPRMKGLIVVE